MRCAKCGAEVKPTDAHCPKCAAGSCAEDFDNHAKPECGTQMTIDDNGGYYEDTRSDQHRIYVKQINFSRNGFWPALLGGILLILIFILALPVALFLIACFAVFIFFARRV